MKPCAPRNRSLRLTPEDEIRLAPQLSCLQGTASPGELIDKVYQQDLFEVLPLLPHSWVDLLILDPPYNLAKRFNGHTFEKRSVDDYSAWMRSWFEFLVPMLKPSASIYVCGDWLTSASIYPVLKEFCIVRNRITWEREKGRAAKANWKNCSEDIWLATVSGDYVFNRDAVQIKRRVMAPYRVSGRPKDWKEEEQGRFRLTHPSNFWSDITVPFWSMPENTEHPTQKPEKLMAKLVLASSREGGVVFDPFLGSGTTAVVCRKLGRRFVGIEMDRHYALCALKRLEMVGQQPQIQGYRDGIFWERNALSR